MVKATMRVFRFQPGVDMDDVESAVLLATLAAEALHGRAQVRLNGRFQVDDSTREMLCDVGFPVGESIASVFTVLATKMLGEDTFTVVDTETAPRGN